MERLGKYEIIEEIGHGGFAVVYKARDTKMNREVALKVIAGGLAQEQTFVERFRQEARVAANLRHPNIIPVHDFGEAADGTLYLAMALIGQGRTLRDLLDEEAPLPLSEALSILTQLARALDYLHRHDPPLTHRDVKPTNVLLEEDAEGHWVVLTDFGLVRSLQASAELTKTGSILGPPAYLAPEQADARKWGDVKPLADVYALGIVAYEMLTGRPPFGGEAPTVLHAHAYEPPPSPLELTPDLGDDLSRVLLRALRKSPEKRYASAGTFVGALQAAADARNAVARREATLEQLEVQAKQLLEAEEWLEALDCCTRMVRLDPDRPAALQMLTLAKQGLDREQAKAVQRRRLAEQYEEGLTLLEEGKWQLALVTLKEVAEGNPDFRDVQEKLAQARDELQRAQWYDEAIAHAQSAHWSKACRAWMNVLRSEWAYRDGKAISEFITAVEGLLAQVDEMASKRQEQEPAISARQPAGLALWNGKAPQNRFVTTYELGDDQYDVSFSIELDDGEFMGECGVAIEESIHLDNECPRKVTAFEVWIFDKNDIRTETKVLASDYAFSDESLRNRLSNKGEVIRVFDQEGLVLDTKTLRVRARVLEATYGVGERMPPRSYFTQMTVELSAWVKDESDQPADHGSSPDQKPLSLWDQIMGR